jgi:hypothetical protein
VNGANASRCRTIWSSARALFCAHGTGTREIGRSLRRARRLAALGGSGSKLARASAAALGT